MLYKMRNKRISLAMAILFALSILLSFAAAPAFAATSYSALTTPTVSSGTDGADLGTLYIKIDPMVAGATTSALFSLPTDFDLHGITPDADGGDAVIDWVGDDNEFKLTVTKDGDSGEFIVYLPLTADIPSGAASGDIVCEIVNLSGQLSSGSVVVGKVSDGTVTVSSSTPEYISNSGTVTFTVKENIVGALERDEDSVKFTLPKGYEWDDDSVSYKANLTGNVDYDVWFEADNKRVMYVDVNSGTTRSILRFDVDIFVDELEAKHGDITVTIGGKSDVDPTKLVVAKYADFGYKVSVDEATENLAGRFNDDDTEIGDIVVEETAPGSLVKNRTILLTLPSGAKWIEAPGIDATNVDVGMIGDGINSDRDTVRYSVYEQSDDKAGKIIFEDGLVATAVDFRGDLKVKISGSAGVTGEVVVATVKAPFTVTADKPNVKIGVQGQPAGDIIITEAEAEALINKKTLTISPQVEGDVMFHGTPTVEVTEGDIEVSIKKTSDALTLTIDSESTEASTIKIAGITMTVNRSYPEGDVTMLFRGSAVDEVNYVPETPWFDKNRNAAVAANAVCVTPAPGDVKSTATFVIGSTTYTVDGVEQTMDVAPYVKDGRTYLPVRYVGYALGVDANNIMWDSASGTVTMIKGDKVVQVTVGSKNMIINGATIAMDAAPEITNGRTMLPFRWIAWAFGASVEWDGATQTVTMEL